MTATAAPPGASPGAAAMDQPGLEAPISDGSIQDEIAAALARDPAFGGVHVSVVGGDVSLSGSVATLGAKWRAARLAEDSRGVYSLTNSVVVNVPVRDDAAVARDVDGAIARDPATKSANARATSDGGVVTIQGSVDSYTQRELLATVAARVPGVKDVRFDTTPSTSTLRSDAELASDARERIADDAALDGAPVTIDVRGGVATLRGAVGSLGQRNAAVRDAWVAGVKRVDADPLAVDWRTANRARDAAPRPLPAAAVTNESDRAIEAQVVERSIENDSAAPGARHVQVTTSSAVVTLRGLVASPEEKKLVVQDAASVPGVARVQDELRVEGYGSQTQPASPAVLRDRVTEATSGTRASAATR